MVAAQQLIAHYQLKCVRAVKKFKTSQGISEEIYML